MKEIEISFNGIKLMALGSGEDSGDGVHVSEEEEKDDDDSDMQRDYKYDSMLSWITLVEECQKRIKPSALLIGKIWTRFYFNLSRIEQEHKAAISKDGYNGNTAKLSNSAKFMRYSVIALLHAVLLEEDEYHVSHEKPVLAGLERNNPVTSVDEFVKQFEKLEEVYGDDCRERVAQGHPIFFILINCPVILAFLFAQGSVNSTKITRECKLYNLVCDVVGRSIPCPDIKDSSSLKDSNPIHNRTKQLLPDDDPLLVIYGLNTALIAGSKEKIGA